MTRTINRWNLVALLGCVLAACVEVTPNEAWQQCKEDPCSPDCEIELRDVYCDGHPDDPKCAECTLVVVEAGVDADEDSSSPEPDATSMRPDADAGSEGPRDADTGGRDAVVPMDTGVDAAPSDASMAIDTALVVDTFVPECLGNLDCPVGKPRCEAGRCAPCASSVDCQPRSATAVCDLGKGSCVECTQAEQLSCSATLEVCKNGGNECVQCNSAQECTNEATPRCGSDSRCAACSADADCERFGKVCDSGQCVQCTGKKTAHCNGSVCNSLMRVCAAGVRPASAEFCERCVSDAQCGKSSPGLCIQTRFGTADVGYYCQPKLAAGETCIDDYRPYIGAGLDVQQKPLRSVDGSTEGSCKLRQTTCAALADYGTKQCGGSGDGASCGVQAQADGVCAAVPGQSAFRCSIPCAVAGDCPLGTTCPPGGGACSL